MTTEGPLSYLCLWEPINMDGVTTATYHFGRCDYHLGIMKHGSRLRHCETVPLSDAAHMEVHVLGHLCAAFVAGPHRIAEFSGSPLDMVEVIHTALRSYRYDVLLAAETQRRTGLEQAEYEELAGRFLTDRDACLKGRTLDLKLNLEPAFMDWQMQAGGRQVPLLHEQFVNVCHHFNAAIDESVTIRFLDKEKGEHSMVLS